MSKQSDETLATIDRVVFNSVDPTVVALTGGWGEGKSYFWKNRVAVNHADVKPGYVSVFGAESLVVIRERVALAAVQLPRSAAWNAWVKKLSPIAAGARKALNLWGEKIGISDSMFIEFIQRSSLKPGWVLCIDDVERLSKDVGLDVFLGYVTELRDEWKLKVVLIYNRERFEGVENNTFRIYEEKVIDRSIPFALDFDDLVSLVFREQVVAGLVRKQSKILGLRNIRILTRARSYFEEVKQVLGENAPFGFLSPALHAILLFAYTKFSNQKPPALGFGMLEKYSEFSDRIRQAEGNQPQDSEFESAKQLLEAYGYTRTDELDLLLMRFVQSDVLDAEKLQELRDAFVSGTDITEKNQRLRAVWNTKYHGSFQDNADEICDAMEHVLPQNLPHLGLDQLDSALRLLNELGRPEAAQRIFDDFVQVRGPSLTNYSGDDDIPGQLSFGPLKAFVANIVSNNAADDRRLGDVLDEVFQKRDFSTRDRSRLETFSIDEFVEYFLVTEQPKLTSKLRFLVTNGDDGLRQKITEVCRRLAGRSRLNEMRLRGMGLLASTELK